MKTVCTYCRKTMEEKKPFGNKLISHGICQDCYDYHVPRLLEQDLSRHLDRHIEPVLMVDSDCRIIGINRRMVAFLGGTKEQLLGLYAGELAGCRYAQLPEGCGKTVHCNTCAIRQTVNQSFSIGTDILNVPAYLDQDDQRIRFVISVFNRKEFIKIVLGEFTEASSKKE